MRGHVYSETMDLDLCRAIRTLGFLAVCGGAQAQIVNLHRGPANDGGGAGWAMFLDLRAPIVPVIVDMLTTASTAGAGMEFSVEVLTRPGSGLGGPVGSGPGSSPTGWTSLGVANARQGGIAGSVSNLIDIPDILVPAGETVGVALRFHGAGPRYFSTGSPIYGVYTTGILEAMTGDVRSAPFGPTGSFSSPREMVGDLWFYTVPEPATLGMLAVSVAYLASRKRRK
jgi:hypothetical protein